MSENQLVPAAIEASLLDKVGCKLVEARVHTPSNEAYADEIELTFDDGSVLCMRVTQVHVFDARGYSSFPVLGVGEALERLHTLRYEADDEDAD